MSAYTVVTAQERERFDALRKSMVRADGPAFLAHDRVVAQYWPLLTETFPEHQFCLVEQSSGQTVGLGHSIPVVFQGAWVDLPAEGLDWVVEKGSTTARWATDRPSSVRCTSQWPLRTAATT